MRTLILTLLFATTVFGQATTENSPSLNTNQHLVTQDTNEVAVLRAQVETMRDYNERLLSTVYWSLGTIAGIAVLLVGFSWFTNYKIYERDKSALKQELNALFSNQLLQIQNKLNEELSGKLEDISTKSVAAAKTISEQSISSLNYKMSSIEKKVLSLRYRAIESEARYWELKGVKGNEIDRYRDMLPLAIELNDENAISKSLEGLLRMFKAGVFPFYGYVPSLVTTLDSLPAKYSTEVAAIKESLKNAKSK